MPMQLSPSVLVAEDDARIRDLIRARLQMSGYDTHTARDGAEALQRIRDLKPAAVILDINMPILDGFGVLGALQANRLMPKPAVLVLTARHAAEDVKRAISLGAKDYLAKPFSETQLLARVARLLRRPPPPPPRDPDVVML